uniref:Secretoglobin family 1D member 4 n=1 Tax=Saimiri boliviensis boliviensis TaxID=39432 RepID=A0A2K6TBK6_SAIBB
MRLSVCLLLVTLALCCYQANAVICQDLDSLITNFLFSNEALIKSEVVKFGASPEAVAAKLTVKKCTDQIAIEKRLSLKTSWGEL